jgi:AcrR family transcriptional regulator
MASSDSALTTNEKILETGLRLFSEKGYLGATTREIAREAGITEVTLFRHFPSKEKLLEEVISTYSFLPALKGLLPEIGNLPYEQALSLIARRFMQTLRLRKDMIRIMNSEMHRHPEKLRKIYQSFIGELYRTLASYFAEMQMRGALRDFDAELAGRALLGGVFSYFNSQMLLQHDIDEAHTERFIQQFVDIFVRGTLK